VFACVRVDDDCRSNGAAASRLCRGVTLQSRIGAYTLRDAKKLLAELANVIAFIVDEISM